MRTLRDMRRSKRLSQSQVAFLLHVDRRQVIKAEARGTDSVELLEKMATLYDQEFSVVVLANRAARDTVPKMIQNA